MMEDFKNLHIDALVDMLARSTAEYTRMRNEGAMKDEFNACQATIILLQAEIIARTGTTATFKRVSFANHTHNRLY